ncbi:hypothetical protein T4B_12629 [Trichinella pseudospiralis]|uniref:Uncharacterized protein n=2 Tax=Trichinella pseudospiralis TaxID=6337 RepID=A0A0V1ESX2_TRIPS|nr:hypothetical protein T4E_11106 [Trichinella pseudospiralis]KRY76753.1 hypothetical protein T4A_8445 [Trichinella pseudospiralis]KRY84931.1 hypothetical protein T4D_2274 [Trichinella pseudospiralis]KRZ32291.1 hypothetical protein T4B_12629 [Trichinella pseudospiralis]KRZ45154.1 hypothetical protein T4C_13422 [Trichinella pseudospiralis]
MAFIRQQVLTTELVTANNSMGTRKTSARKKKPQVRYHMQFEAKMMPTMLEQNRKKYTRKWGTPPSQPRKTRNQHTDNA